GHVGPTGGAVGGAEGRARLFHRLCHEEPDASECRRGRLSRRATSRGGRPVAEREGQGDPAMNGYQCVAPDVRLGKGVKLGKFVNLYGCEVGDNTKIGPFVEIQRNAKIGRNCKISSHTFICEGVTIEDNVFIGHGVTFINDTYPRATTPRGELQTENDWHVEPTLVRTGA